MPSRPSIPTGIIRANHLIGPIAGDWAAFAAAMAKGDLYVNVHSTANPAGVVRVQIPATTPPAAATPAPTPKPPATGEGLAHDDTFSGAAIAGILLMLAAASVTGVQLARRRA